MQIEMKDSEFELLLPPDFNEGLWDSKGFFGGAVLVVGQKMYRLAFYDPVRLAQDAQAEIAASGFFFEENLIVVEEVKREVMRGAAERIVKSGGVRRLIPSDRE